MSNPQQQVFETVLSINPYNDTYYAGAGNQLNVEKSPHFGKKQYVISYINTNDFITTLISVSKNIPDEDLAFVIETKVYEELALDIAVEYKVDYIEIRNGEEEQKERTFHVFVVDPLVLEEIFASAVTKVQYLDRIIPVPLLIQPLYAYEIIQGHGAHCFIYFQENDAFFTLYKGQEFIYTKSLKYSFNEMHERFSELLGEQIPAGDFQAILAHEGLGTQNPEYQKYLIKLFGELFLHINDVLTYAKRAYEIETIDEIFIGSQLGAILGLDEYCQTYLGFESKPFDFSYGYATDRYIDQVHQLMQLYATTEPEARYEANFSPFHRPPPFLRRQSGRLIAVTAASLVAAFAYPVSYWTMSYAESVHKTILEGQYQETHPLRLTREATINLKLAQRAEAQQQLEAEKALFAERKTTLEQIHEIKVNYPMKGKIMASLTQDLNRYKVSLSEVIYHEKEDAKTFTLSLMAKDDKQISDLLAFLTHNRAEEFHYNMETIYWDDSSNYYRSQVKVVLK